MSSLITKIKTNVNIKDKLTGEVLFDGHNAINNQNMATAIARGLSNTDMNSTGSHQIYALALGNGGSFIDSSNSISYLPPNVSGQNTRLYNQTYSDIVDEQQSGTSLNNSVTYQQGSSDISSIIVVTMTIGAGSPAGQSPTDTPTSTAFNSEFSFDELGLFTYGTVGSFTATSVPTDSLMLTHLIFSPILKTAAREITVTYTLGISVS